jgi:hypothetical protein
MMASARCLSTAALAAALAACFQPAEHPVGDGAPLPIDLFTLDAGPDAPGCGADPSPLSALHITVRTTAPGGRFKPRNVGAVWIEDGAGAFVKTVERWGVTRAKYLARFNQVSDGNVADAITGPTLLAHRTHELTWNLADLAGCEVPAGDYAVLFEVVDKSGVGPWFAVPFVKGSDTLLLTPADEPTFHDLRLELE